MKISTLEVFQFLVLFAILAVSSMIFNYTADTASRFFIIFVDAVLYVIWGCWHHYSKDRLNTLVLVEYSLVSLLVILLAALGLGIIRFF